MEPEARERSRRGGPHRRAPAPDAPHAGHAEPPRRTDGLGRKLLRWCAYALAGGALLGAVTLTGLRVFLPELGHYRPQVEAWLSRIADRQVEVGAIHADWRGWTPVFRIEDVRLSGIGATANPPADPDGASAVSTPVDRSIRLAEVRFSVDPLDLLRSRALQPRGIAVSGASFAVVRRPDGTFTVGEFGEPAPGRPGENGRLARWLPGQATITLRASRIVWVDEQRSLPPLPFDGVTLHLEHVGGRYRISGVLEPPEAGGRIDFATDLAGDAPAPSWTGPAYVAARDVDLARLGIDALLPGTEEISGVVSGQAWSTWKDGRLVEAEGTIRARSPAVVHEGSRRGLDELAASFTVGRGAEGWTLALRDLAVATSNDAWPVSGAGAKWSPPHDGREGALVVNADFVRIEDLVALAAPNGGPSAGSWLDSLIEAAPGGAVEDLRISAPITDRVEFKRARVRGRFSRLRVGPEDWPVSVRAAGGRFEANEHGMVADVVAGSLRLRAPDRLARPVEGGKLTGALTALRSPKGFRVRFDTATDVTGLGAITAEGWTLVPLDEGPPELSIALSLGASRIAAVRALIADGVAPERVLHWLDSAMPQGEVRRARLAFHGHLSEASSGAGAGTLEATAALAVPVLRYARGWPEITDVAAVAAWAGPRLDVRFESGRILGSSIREAAVTIEDLGAEARVAAQVEARVEGASADAVRFLAESPLRTRFAPMIDGFTIHGDSTIDLDLAVPLGGSGRPITAGGRITLADNRIGVPGLRRELASVDGAIAFRGATVESDGITATWLGEPIRAVVGASPEAPDTTRLTIGGHLTPRLLATYLHDAGLVEAATPGGSPLLARIRGGTAWNAILDFPRAGGARPVKLRIASDLAGLSLDLPPPFGKAGATARMLDVDSHATSAAERTIEVRLDGVGSAALRLVRDRDGDRFRLERGAIRLGAGDAALPDVPGVTVHGALPVLDTRAWDTFLEDAAAGRSPDTHASWLDLVREVSVETGSVTALGARFPDTRIRAAPGDGGGWWLDLAGPRLEGAVQIPSDPETAPVTVGLERFVLEPGSAGGEDEPYTLDPRTLPALSFSAGRFVLGGIDLGHVSFTTAPSEHGMELQRLDVQAGAFAGEATGRWSLAGEEHRTTFAMRMYGDDLGRMLDSLGFDGDGVAGGTTNLSLRGSWPGSPADFALDRLAGVMHFLSTDGRLTRVEPGVAGRVFGLLTVTSLPRRLFLDFGDLFRDGFEYDRIDGNFAIENGNAHTEDLFMESDSARIEIVGRTGLVSEDYDKLVTVFPKISSSLPLLGLPILNPALLPAWLAQQIIDRNIFDKAFAYRYTVTGTWDEPVVELVRVRKQQDDGGE